MMYIQLYREDPVKNKKKNHFIRRLEQRYKMTISDNDYFRINSMLRTIQPMVNSIGGKISVYPLPILGSTVYIIFDEMFGVARTCYPPDPGEPWQEIVNRYDSMGRNCRRFTKYRKRMKG